MTKPFVSATFYYLCGWLGAHDNNSNNNNPQQVLQNICGWLQRTQVMAKKNTSQPKRREQQVGTFLDKRIHGIKAVTIPKTKG